ncbi:MAG: glycine--tRNA ligase subunit beta [Candidatus Tectimicrobiota bacterium]
MSATCSFQDIILRLLTYWKEQGCLVQQPYNVQVGAGTMNPATALRVLGPEPWNVAYIEPSIRPDDGRFGDNPNRMQMHHQLQVILKPDPGNPQELYLKSLEAIGIDPRQHDIRFVEDNWESPALGAWGLGWEVWLDGQEITQFTYFQQAGGQTLDPVAVEITYGLDRITLALQGLESIWTVDYGASIPYGDILLASEIEHCRYYFDVADVEALKAVYDTYEREAKHCLEAKLVFPAHDYNLKCSHLFNVLDTRGAIGVTERANYFRRMRNIARDISTLYLAQRQELDYPLCKHRTWQAGTPEAAAPDSETTALVDGVHPFVLEIGSEELPSDDLTAALAQLQSSVPALLQTLRLAYERVEVHGTPRRLAVLVHGLVSRQPDLESLVKGPPANRAFDAQGKPTQAAVGFARSRGVPVEALQVIEDNGGRYVAAVVHETGRHTVQVLGEALPDCLAALTFGKSMRWNSTNVAYSRPLRWLLALYGPHVVPCTYAGVSSGRRSRGLRPYDSPTITIDDAAHYEQSLRQHGIVLQREERQATITTEAAALAAQHGGSYRHDQELLDEVTNLVECPTVFCGRFEARFLALPAAVLVAVMKKHQRYFPLYAADGSLLPYFLAVRNGDAQHLDTVTAGNEQVLRARFADAEFFYKHDRQQTLAEMLPQLATLTFQARLGSMLDKVQRLEQLTPRIARLLGLSASETAVAQRAAALSKADLATRMVVEMTSLQGIMGSHYARASGESEAVAAALAEQYQLVSSTRPGLALALADRLDSLLGLFAAGLAPRGSNDPFALRRAALGVIENLIANQQPCDVREALASAASLLPVPCESTTQTAVLSFMEGRLEGILRERGIPAAVVRAVLAVQGHNPYAASLAATALAEAITAPDWQSVLEAFARCVRITRQLETTLPLRPEALRLTAEQALWMAYQTAAATCDGSVPRLVAALRGLVPAIRRFFVDVLVMDEDLPVRENRLALLQQIAHLPQDVADLTQLEGF